MGHRGFIQLRHSSSRQKCRQAHTLPPEGPSCPTSLHQTNTHLSEGERDGLATQSSQTRTLLPRTFLTPTGTGTDLKLKLQFHPITAKKKVVLSHLRKRKMSRSSLSCRRRPRATPTRTPRRPWQPCTPRPRWRTQSTRAARRDALFGGCGDRGVRDIRLEVGTRMYALVVLQAQRTRSSRASRPWKRRNTLYPEGWSSCQAALAGTSFGRKRNG